MQSNYRKQYDKDLERMLLSKLTPRGLVRATRAKNPMSARKLSVLEMLDSSR
jgi:hypothetical protein